MKTLFLCLCLFLFIVSTASATVVRFEPATLNVAAGAQQTVTILVEPTETIDTVAIDYLSWDSSIIECLGIERGDLFTDATIWLSGVIDNENGSMGGTVWASVNATNKSGAYITLVFYGKKDGATSIIISENGCGIAHAGIDVQKIIKECAVIVYGDGNVITPEKQNYAYIGIFLLFTILILSLILLLRKKE